MIFILCTIISNVIELADPMISEDMTVLGKLTAYSRIEATDVVGIASQFMNATGDVIAGLWEVLWFNYTFFYDVDPVTGDQTSNEWTMVRYALFFPITVGLLFAIAMTIGSLIRGGGGS